MGDLLLSRITRTPCPLNRRNASTTPTQRRESLHLRPLFTIGGMQYIRCLFLFSLLVGRLGGNVTSPGNGSLSGRTSFCVLIEVHIFFVGRSRMGFSGVELLGPPQVAAALIIIVACGQGCRIQYSLWRSSPLFRMDKFWNWSL
jgi:hypothetical protein